MDDERVVQDLMARCDRISALLVRYERVHAEFMKSYRALLSAFEKGDAKRVKSLRATVSKALSQGNTFHSMLWEHFEDVDKLLKSWKPSDDSWAVTKSGFQDIVREFYKVHGRVVAENNAVLDGLEVFESMTK